MIAGAHDGENFIVKEYSEPDAEGIFKEFLKWVGGIRKTCPCNEYPLKPHFYMVKLGYAGVNLFFLFFYKT